MSRRLGYALPLVLVACVLAACSGAEAQRAQELLGQVQAAQAKERSATVDMRMVVSSGDQHFTMNMHGGGYLRGPRAGDQYVSISTEGLPVPVRADVVTLRGHGYLRMNGVWQSFPLPAQAAATPWAGTMSELARYVKDVHVTENTVVAGVRGATVSGVLDTAGLIRAMSQMSAFSGAAGGGSSFLADELSKHVSDMRVVLFISARTHLIRSAALSFAVNDGGKTAKFDLYLSRTSVNQPVAIPTP